MEISVERETILNEKAHLLKVYAKYSIFFIYALTVTSWLELMLHYILEVTNDIFLNMFSVIFYIFYFIEKMY